MPVGAGFSNAALSSKRKIMQGQSREPQDQGTELRDQGSLDIEPRQGRPYAYEKKDARELLLTEYTGPCLIPAPAPRLHLTFKLPALQHLSCWR